MGEPVDGTHPVKLSGTVTNPALELVMSRTALLDISVMFWVLAAFGCLLIDRVTSTSSCSAN